MSYCCCNNKVFMVNSIESSHFECRKKVEGLFQFYDVMQIEKIFLLKDSRYSSKSQKSRMCNNLLHQFATKLKLKRDNCKASNDRWSLMIWLVL